MEGTNEEGKTVTQPLSGVLSLASPSYTCFGIILYILKKNTLKMCVMQGHPAGCESLCRASPHRWQVVFPCFKSEVTGK